MPARNERLQTSASHSNFFSRSFVFSRDIPSLICRFCIFVVRNAAYAPCSVTPAWPPKVKPTGGWTS
jgi:hypothetical protein